jgi:glucosamine--fructose-6-phosphate aminotransferase (isomerizing)
VAVVHNGIIENFAELKAELQAAGREFESDTDTEVVAHLLDAELAKGLSPLDAFKATLDRLRGAYALCVLIGGEDETILAARNGPPLAVGYGDGEMFVGSDGLALGPFTNRIAYLNDGDYVILDHKGARIFDAERRARDRPIKIVPPRPC